MAEEAADPLTEELDLFGVVLPLPYRLAVLVVLGVWFWGLNLRLFYNTRINVPVLIRYPARQSHTEAPHYLSVFRLATVLSIPLLISLPLFWIITRGSTEKVLGWSILPNACLLIICLALILPFQPLSRSGRARLLSVFRRISIGGLASLEGGRFGDVLLADALTSYAKPLSEIYVTLCMFVTRQQTTNRPDRHCGSTYAVPIIIALPFVIRFRQCLIAEQPANAVKYLTALPVIVFSVLQRESTGIGLSQTTASQLWFFSAMVNSLYSFYWDVKEDWGLSLFSRTRASADHPYGLRRNLFFYPPEVYYGAIFIDLLLRCTWSLKLSVHMEHFYDVEGGIFALEILEVARRWMWAFLRIEHEWNKGTLDSDHSLTDMAPNTNKLDED